MDFSLQVSTMETNININMNSIISKSPKIGTFRSDNSLRTTETMLRNNIFIMEILPKNRKQFALLLIAA